MSVALPHEPKPEAAMESALATLLHLLARRAQADPELAAALRQAAQSVLAVLEAPLPAQPPRAPAEATTPEPALSESAAPEPMAPEPMAPEPVAPEPMAPLDPDALRKLQAWGNREPYGQAPPEAGQAPRSTRPAATDDALPPLAARLRFKAEVARWHAGGADPARRHALRSKVGEVEGLGPEVLKGVPGGTPEGWGHLADAYEAAATAAALLWGFAEAGHVLSAGSAFSEAVEAAAEAQSAVRAAYWALRGSRAAEVPPSPHGDDPDQVGLFTWLREACEVDRVFIARYMKWQDAADPARASGVERRLRGIAKRAGLPLLDDHRAGAGRALKRLDYHLKRFRQDPDHWEAADHLARLLNQVEAVVEEGLPYTDTQLRERLVTVATQLPDADDPSLGPRTRRVLAALYDHLYNDAQQEAVPAQPARQAPHLAEAARLLAGKRLALFGGEPRPQAEAALIEAFGLGGVEWVETRAHQSTAPFETAVARADVVVQLIRWSSHSFGDLRGQCAAHGKPFVRAPGGYNPSTLARNVLDQISSELQAGSA